MDRFLYVRNGSDSDAVGACSVRDPSVIHAWGMRRHARNESACTWNVREAFVFGRAPLVIRASACVECSWNTAP